MSIEVRQLLETREMPTTNLGSGWDWIRVSICVNYKSVSLIPTILSLSRHRCIRQCASLYWKYWETLLWWKILSSRVRWFDQQLFHWYHPARELWVIVRLVYVLYVQGCCLYMLKRVHLISMCSNERNHKSDDDETGSDIDLFLLSQDIDSAIERFLPSSISDCTHSTSTPNGAQLLREDFFPAKLNSWNATCCDDEGILNLFFEFLCLSSIRVSQVKHF